MGRENAGRSNRNCDENSQRRKFKVSSAMTISGGLGDPKDNLAFVPGRPMASRLIFRPRFSVLRDDGENKVEHVIGFVFLVSRVACWQIRTHTPEDWRNLARGIHKVINMLSTFSLTKNSRIINHLNLSV
jgi:hypothetical protein